MSALATWRELIAEEMERQGDSVAEIVGYIGSEHFDTEFDCGPGSSCGTPFTLWTTRRVYFPVTYDGIEVVGSAPRNPCDEAMKHVGGE